MTMRILVTGATGFLGLHLCRRLVDEGHAVTAFSRASSDRTLLQGLSLAQCEGDMTDADAVARAVQGHDAVIHAAANLTYWRGVRDVQNRVNIDGTRHVVDACLRHGVRRLVYVSSVAAIGIPADPNTPANENFTFNLERSGLNYHISKRRAEESALRAASQGLEVVVVNPGSLFGPYGKRFRGGAMMVKARRGPVVPYFRGGISAAHVDDVAAGIVCALTQGRSGQRYILAGDNVTYRKIVEVSAQAMGLERRFVPVPTFVTALEAAVLEPLSMFTGKRPGMTYDTHYCSNRFQFYDSYKAQVELGYSPRSFADIVHEYLAYAKA